MFSTVTENGPIQPNRPAIKRLEDEESTSKSFASLSQTDRQHKLDELAASLIKATRLVKELLTQAPNPDVSQK